MSKKFLKIVSILAVVGFAVSVLWFKYNRYNRLKEKVSEGILLDFGRPINDYKRIKGELPEKRNEFMKFLEKDTETYEFIIKDLLAVEFGLVRFKDSVCVYSNGFDRDDDQGRKLYSYEDVSFVESLFVDGDILIICENGNGYDQDIDYRNNKELPKPPQMRDSVANNK